MKEISNGARITIGIERPSAPEYFINTLPPLGALGLTSYLTAKGFEVAFADANIETVDWVKLTHDSDFVAFSVNMANVERTLVAVHSIKTHNPKTIVVLGGPLVSSAPEVFAQIREVDFIVVGEGENALLDIVEKRQSRDTSRIFFAEEVKDLDSLPFPDITKININRYKVPLSLKNPISNIVTSRGCPFGFIS